MPDDDDNEYPEPVVYFDGECTCGHERDEHGWGHCDVKDCKCDAGWCE